jgi:streptogramin lyase
MAPIAGDRLAVAVGSDGTVGFASTFVHGTYANSILSFDAPQSFGGGPITYGRGVGGDLYSGNLAQNQSAPPYVRNERSGTTWILAQEFPVAIIAGPDGYTWVLTSLGMERLNADGTSTLAKLLTPFAGAFDVALGSDGAFWIAESNGNIERMPLAIRGTTFAVGGHPMRISAGGDGALWFLDSDGLLRRISTSGNVTTVAAVNGGVSQGDAIALGGDGAIWFTEASAGKLARVAANGSIAEFDVPSDGATPSGLTSGGDGSLWFLEQKQGLTLVHATLSAATTTVRF